MAIQAYGSPKSDYAKCPTGVWPAVCVDVIDLGEKETPFKIEQGPRAGEPKIAHQIQVIFLVDAEDEDGNPARRDDGGMHRLGKYFNLSLNEKSNLRKDLDRWRGIPFTDEQLQDGWDVESIIGAQAQVNIIHVKDSKGETRARVESILARNRKAAALGIGDYAREMDRPGGYDVRSPEAEEQSTGGYDNPATYKQEEEDDSDQDTLPF